MKTIKRIFLLVVSAGAITSLIVFALVSFGQDAHAQLFTYTGTSTSPSSSVVMSSSASNATTTIAPSISPTSTVTPMEAGYIQFNNLVVTGPIDTAESVPTMLVGTSAASTCSSFATASAAVGMAIACPTTASSSYMADVSPSTELLLSNRQPAVAGDFALGDVVNVFGYYDGIDSIEASVVRNLSRAVSFGVGEGSAGSSASASTQSLGSALATLSNVAQGIQTIVTEGASESSTFVSSGEAGEMESVITALQNLITQITTSSAGGPMIPYNPSSTTSSILVSTSTTGTYY
jgi:hypothetical protein